MVQRQQAEDADEEVMAENATQSMLAKRPAEIELTDLEQQFWLRVGKSAKSVEQARAQFHQESDSLISMLKERDQELGWNSVREEMEEQLEATVTEKTDV